MTQPDPKRIRALNAFAAHLSAAEVVEHAAAGLHGGRVALVSSFGAEAVVLLHMVAQVDRAMPVLFADTQMLFAETLKYQQEVAETLGLLDVRRITPDPAALVKHDPLRDLHHRSSNACCDLRKVQPIVKALEGFDVVLSGRKQHQSAERAALDVFEQDAGGRIKVNPLAAWSVADVASYLDTHALPRHPLVAKGYPSLGCAPCTTPVAAGEDPRAGRWRDQDKTECGIHFAGGVAVRGGPDKESAA
ncbi:MAG: phosphoadenylyl-sulfate reductase [Pseudomonadota bacterium]